MATFADTAGREWVIDIDVNALRRVRKRLDLKLMDVIGGETLDRLADDPVLLVDMLYVLCQEQAERDGVSDEEFGRALRGDVLDAAVGAFLEALTDFCPSRKRDLLRRLIAKGGEAESRILAKAEAMLASGKIDQLVNESLSPRPSPDSPASSELTPAP